MSVSRIDGVLSLPGVSAQLSLGPRVSMANLTGCTRRERAAIQQFLPQPDAQCWTNHSTVFNNAAVTLQKVLVSHDRTCK